MNKKQRKDAKRRIKCAAMAMALAVSVCSMEIAAGNALFFEKRKAYAAETAGDAAASENAAAPENGESVGESTEEVTTEEEFIWEPEGTAAEEEEIILDPDLGKPDAVQETFYDQSFPSDGEEAGLDMAGSDAQMLMEAIKAQDQAVIIISRDLEIDGTIRIPRGKTVELVPAEGVTAIIRRTEGFEGELFYIEEGGSLLLWEQTAGGTLLPGDIDEKNNGTELIRNEGIVKVYRDSGQSPAGKNWDSAVIGNGVIAVGEEETAVDIGQAQIELVHGDWAVYTGEPKTPEVEVWLDRRKLIEGTEYEVTYRDNVDAGTASVMVSGCAEEGYTGTDIVPFFISPAVPEYRVSDQSIEMGMSLSQLKVPSYATGVKGEKVKGSLIWSDSEGGSILPDTMPLSGAAGEVMTMYWTFLPEKKAANYTETSGKVNLTFAMSDGYGDHGFQWDMNTVGNLSNSDSAYGVTTEKNEISHEGNKNTGDGADSAGNGNAGTGSTENSPGNGNAGTGSTESSAESGSVGNKASENGNAENSSGEMEGEKDSKSTPATGDPGETEFWTGMLVLSGMLFLLFLRKRGFSQP